MRLKLTLFTILLFSSAGFFSVVKAQDPEDLIIDTKCNTYLSTASDNFRPYCNSICKRECIDSGNHCPSGSTQECTVTDAALDLHYLSDSRRLQRNFNILGVELCPDPATRPPDDPYCMINLIRLGFYGVISLLVFILVLIALWVVWVRSTAADSPEKVEKAATIAKNAIVGALITFLFISIVQVVSLLVGLTGNIFEITIVPQPKLLNSGDRCSQVGYVSCPVGTACVPRVPGSDIKYCN